MVDSLGGGDPFLVSEDRRATLIPINIGEVDDAGAVIDVVERADEGPGLRGHDHR